MHSFKTWFFITKVVITKCKSTLFRCNTMYKIFTKMQSFECYSSSGNNETNMLSAAYIGFPVAVLITLLITKVRLVIFV